MNPVERIASIISIVSVAGGAGEQVDLWSLASELSDIGNQVEEMQKALKWYADGSNWGSIEEYGVFISDGGECARKTLQSMKGATS